jgi:acetyl-CoA synthetase
MSWVVIPARDEIKGKVPDLYVSLKPGQQPSEEICKRVEKSVRSGPLPARAVW